MPAAGPGQNGRSQQGGAADPLAGGRRVFAVVNAKGGVGKTTTCLNLAAAWSEQGKQVLLVDLDPSGTLTRLLGIPLNEADPGTPSSFHLVKGNLNVPLASVVCHTAAGLDLVPANLDLARVPFLLHEEPDWARFLDNSLSRLPGYDVVVIDCPPESMMFTYLALGAATDAVVVLMPEGPSLLGMGEMQRRIERMRSVNPKLRRERLVVNMMVSNQSLGRDVVASLRAECGDQVCKTTIPRRVSVAEANTSRATVIAYEPRGAVAESYRALARELWSAGGGGDGR